MNTSTNSSVAESETKDSSSSQNDFGRRAWKKISSHSFLFLASIYLGRIVQGFYLAALATTLLFLRENVGASGITMSFIFTGSALGYLIGSTLASFVVKRKNAMKYLGFGVLFWGIFLIFMPFLKSIFLLIAASSSIGILIGLFDAGGQGVILKIWGEKHSRTHIQMFHFSFTIGAVIAPLIAKPFLAILSNTEDNSRKCPHTNSSRYGDYLNEVKSQNDTTKALSLESNASFNPVVFAYVIYSSVTIFSALFILCLSYRNVTLKITRNFSLKSKCERSKCECRKEQPLREVLPMFILYTLFLFAQAGADHPIFSYIFAVAVCSKLQFTDSLATLLSSLFWCGYGVGRLIAIWFSRFLQPQTIIITCLIGCMTSLIFLCVAGENTAAVTWVGTFCYSFFSAPLIPSSISWMVKFFNLSGKYVFIIVLGNALGSITMVTVSGVIFQKKPFAVFFTAAGMIGLACLVFLALVLMGKRRPQSVEIIDIPLQSKEKEEKC